MMVEFIKVNGRNAGDIKLLTLSTCGWCKKTKAFLRSRNIAYSYLDVDLLSEDEVGEVAGEWGKYSPNWSFPTIIVNNSEAIAGYNLSALERLAGE